MLSVAARCRPHLTRLTVQTTAAVRRSFSSVKIQSKEEEDDRFEAVPPKELTVDMAEGIAETTQFYIRYGSSHQRLQWLASQTDMPVVTKWQKMMEVFLLTQVQVISGMGYKGDEQGLAKYAQDLSVCVQKADPSLREIFADTRRTTWRELVATCFDLKVDDIPTLSIVDAYVQCGCLV